MVKIVGVLEVAFVSRWRGGVQNNDKSDKESREFGFDFLLVPDRDLFPPYIASIRAFTSSATLDRLLSSLARVLSTPDTDFQSLVRR